LALNEREESERSKTILLFFVKLSGGLIGEIVPGYEVVISTTSGGNSTYSNYTNYSTYKSPYGINEIGDYTFVGTEIASPNFQGRISDTNI
jgi:hypothetical protein